MMSLFMLLQHIPTMRSCNYSNLPMLYIVSNVPSVVLNRMFDNVNWRHVIVCIFILNKSNGLIVF